MNSERNTTFPEFERPAGWERMAIVDRCGWLRRSGVAGDLLEAMAILKAAGEWPSEEDLDMAGGRALSPMRRTDYARDVKRAAAPVSEGRVDSRPPRRGMRPARGERRAAPGSITPDDGGRRDRLAEHY